MEFYQACYGKPLNDYELFHVSPEAKPGQVAVFEKFSKACGVDALGGERELLNAEGTAPSFYQLVCEDDTVCAIRAEYADRDNGGRGRLKVFAHGFMFRATESFRDPNTVLTISDSNFKFDAESTKETPSVLEREEAFEYDECLRMLALDREKMKCLMACVYTLLASPTNFPFYVVCKKEMRVVKSAIYCILRSLPYQLRYHLSFANGNLFRNASFKRIMFVEKIPEGGLYYFSTETGETNMNLSEVTSISEKHPAYAHFAEEDPASFSAYLARLEEIAERMGYAFNASYAELAMAEILLRGASGVGKKSDGELMKYALELLTRIPQQNLYIDEYIADILRLLYDRKLELNDSVMNRIELRARSSQSEKMVEVAKLLKCQILARTGKEAVVAFLAAQRKSNEELFEEWCTRLAKTEAEDGILLYYQKNIQSTKEYADLVASCMDAKEYWKTSAVKESAKEQCFRITLSKISVSTMRKDSFSEIANQCHKVTEKLFEGAAMEVYKQILFGIRDRFWEGFTFDAFAMESVCIANCTAFALRENKKSEIAMLLSELFAKVTDYKKGAANYLAVEQQLAIMAEKMEKLNPSDQDYSAILPCVRNFLLESMKEEANGHFITWVNIARFDSENVNPLFRMIEWSLPVLCDEELFTRDFDESERMRENFQLILDWMIGEDQKSGILATLEPGDEMAKTLKKEVKLLLDFKKQVIAEQKSMEKEQKRLEKQKKKEASLDDADPDMLLGGEHDSDRKKKGFFGLFDKRK